MRGRKSENMSYADAKPRAQANQERKQRITRKRFNKKQEPQK